jgi:uncharacterized protein YqjF (DUF2071 family)
MSVGGLRHRSVGDYEPISPHAPEAVPRAAMLQGWYHLTFLHWRYNAALLRSFIPSALEIDTFDGSAWVGLTPFLLKNLRLPHLPPLPWLSKFAETNLRTYVRHSDGSRGIWFFSLDCARLAAVVAARLSYRLPYKWASMQADPNGQQMHYLSRRKDASADIAIEIGTPLESPPQLAIFLTARFRLYTLFKGKLAYAQVEHEPWPLHTATATKVQQTIIEAAGLPTPRDEPMVHYSPGVEVRIGWPQLLD